VGPFIPKEAVARISEYVGAAPRFDDLEGVEAYLRSVHASFGPLTPDQWRHMAEHSFRRPGDGTLALHYDPGIAVALKAIQPADVVLWSFWDAIRCPVLVLRGAESDLLSRETVGEMRSRGPGAGLVEVVEIPNVGHAPALLSEEQIALVKSWLGGS
jgi:pimeloyl-ACP methyl ester carboxylesterase